jgi:hypothetical protein
MTERQLAGQKGGKSTASRYGSGYMASLGKQGGAFRDPTIEELRRMAEIKNIKKGGKSTDNKNTQVLTVNGVIIQRSKSGNMVKEIGAVS